MKIKKNGKVINLTESDIKKLRKNILNEQHHVKENDYERLKGDLLKSLKSGPDGDVRFIIKSSESKGKVYVEFKYNKKDMQVTIDLEDLIKIIPFS